MFLQINILFRPAYYSSRFLLIKKESTQSKNINQTVIAFQTNYDFSAFCAKASNCYYKLERAKNFSKSLPKRK